MFQNEKDLHGIKKNLLFLFQKSGKQKKNDESVLKLQKNYVPNNVRIKFCFDI